MLLILHLDQSEWRQPGLGVITHYCGEDVFDAATCINKGCSFSSCAFCMCVTCSNINFCSRIYTGFSAMFLLAVCLLSVLVVSHAQYEESFATPVYKSDCDKEWKKLSPKHTMCIKGDHGTDVPFDINVPLNAHNTLRGQVSPPATDMRKVYWDADVAEVAAKWARQCNTYGDHDPNEARSMEKYKYMSIGQNMAMDTDFNWTAVVGYWYDEHENFKYGVGATKDGVVTGHYTQLVSKEVYRIGCGAAKCKSKYGDEHYYICNYVTGEQSLTPYTKGVRCASCKSKCSNGLCDCGDKACLYQSKPSGCSCQCQPHMSGDDCSTIDCKDDSDCNEVGKDGCRYENPEDTPFIQYTRYVCQKTCGMC